MKRSFALQWLLEPLQEDPSFFTKAMFGGLAVYYHEKMVLVLMESPGDRKWKDQTFAFDLWDGLLFPTFREHHSSLKSEFPALVPHPVLGKWLYLPASIDSKTDSKIDSKKRTKDFDFETTAQELIRGIQQKDPRLGIVPGEKKNRKIRRKTSKKTRKNS